MIVMTVNGLIQGCLPVMSFNFGAGNPMRLKQAFRIGTGLASGMMLLGTVLVSAFPKQILKLFRASENMFSFGVPALHIMSAGFVFNGISTMIATYMQAIGRVRCSIAINLLRQLVILVPMMGLLSRFLGLTGIWLAVPVTEILTVLTATVLYRKAREPLACPV